MSGILLMFLTDGNIGLVHEPSGSCSREYFSALSSIFLNILLDERLKFSYDRAAVLCALVIKLWLLRH